MSVLPIGFIPITPPQPPTPTAGTDAASSKDFGNTFTNALDQLDQAQKAADESSKLAATGDVESIEAHMAALTEVQLATQLTVAVRNRAVEAFNEIMRMPI
ncbi:MAG TPA: flagellar hook-basal body complex protein FliE [Acidimicrobiales bacterium]